MLLKREALCALAIVAAFAIGLLNGCINKPQDPSATQPSTIIDLATTQPYYWYAKPAVAQVQGRDFDAIWDTCKDVARDYLFALDRDDYRSGIISTVPLVSKQWFEPWRPDTGSIGEAFANSLGAIRRTLRFELTRNPDDTYTIAPKVLIEREVILERNVTDVSQYRFAFSGPATKIPPREAVTLDPETFPDLPIKYWYPTGRDAGMEIGAAERLRHALQKRNLLVNANPTNTATNESPAPTAPPLQASGVVSAKGPGETIYINLGATEKIVTGMTFEVYEARSTLPTIDTYAKENRQSKGWIEVVAVGNGSSLCKIIQPAGKTPPKQEDEVFNFVFRRDRQNRFLVAGDFAGERETITGLIWRWNGVVDTKIAPQIDYLILGNPPADGPARQVYDSIKSQAEQLKIPILSEARFNLLIRYYNPDKR